MLAVDGLDEAPETRTRERVARIVSNAARVWPNCRIVVTTRPKAYSEDALLTGFAEARIGSLDKNTVRMFLRRWSEALVAQNPGKAARCRELVYAVESRADIRRIAQNPVMLTALAVLHWNEKRLPQQRAELYESVLTWLAQSRKLQTQPARRGALHSAVTGIGVGPAKSSSGAPSAGPARLGKQEILRWPRFREISTREEQIERASAFLDDEELDSGIVVRRGADIRFWHLTFQEHLAARWRGPKRRSATCLHVAVPGSRSGAK